MAYDLETQILGMDIKDDTGVTVKRVRSTKFPFFKESTVFSESTNSTSPGASVPSSPEHANTYNPVSKGRAAAVTSSEHTAV